MWCILAELPVRNRLATRLSTKDGYWSYYSRSPTLGRAGYFRYPRYGMLSGIEKNELYVFHVPMVARHDAGCGYAPFGANRQHLRAGYGQDPTIDRRFTSIIGEAA